MKFKFSYTEKDIKLIRKETNLFVLIAAISFTIIFAIGVFDKYFGGNGLGDLYIVLGLLAGSLMWITWVSVYNQNIKNLVNGMSYGTINFENKFIEIAEFKDDEERAYNRISYEKVISVTETKSFILVNRSTITALPKRFLTEEELEQLFLMLEVRVPNAKIKRKVNKNNNK